MTSPPIDYSLLLGFLGGLIPIAATLLGGLNWLNNRFSHLERIALQNASELSSRIAQNAADLRLLQERWSNTEDKITTVANGNKESVQHARDRLLYEINRLDRELSCDLNDIASYLAKKGDFVIRTRSAVEQDNASGSQSFRNM